MSGWLAEEKSLKNKFRMWDFLFSWFVCCWVLILCNLIRKNHKYYFLMKSVFLTILFLVVVITHNTNKEISSVYTRDEYNAFFGVFLFHLLFIGLEHNWSQIWTTHWPSRIPGRLFRERLAYFTWKIYG